MRIAIAEDKPLRCPLLNHLSLVHKVPAVAVGVRLVRSRRLLPLGGCVRGFHVFILQMFAKLSSALARSWPRAIWIDLDHFIARREDS